VTVVQLKVAVDAKPEKLEKELIAHVRISQMMDMLNRSGLASSANALLPVDHLFSKVFPLFGIQVSVIPIAPFWFLGFAGIHGETMY
jgi:hypothetical protein